MSFKEKNIAVTLASFSLIMVIFLISVSGMINDGGLTSAGVFRLWLVVIVLAVVFTIAATILTAILSTIIEAIRTGTDDPRMDDLEDERDKMIDLRGTKVTYQIYSVGAFLAMLTFVLSQPPLVMFTLLIFFGVLAQIAGDIVRLALYRRGF